jgi:transketolase
VKKLKGKRLSVPELEALSREVRASVLRVIYEAGSGHPGGSLSSVDIMLTLYFHEMNHDPSDPKWSERDRFILSKGHAVPALYTVLAKAGYIPEASLDTLRLFNSPLQGHPDALRVPGIEVSSGSLGNGLSVASGIAAAAKMDGKKLRVFCLLGDGECDEGLVWEAAMLAPHLKLNNLIAIVDRNRLQIDGCTEDVVCLDPLPDKWRAFNWNVVEADGHDYVQLMAAFKKVREHRGGPSVIIANTVKGKGVSFMEGVASFHGKPPSKEQLDQALKELEAH